MNFEIYTQRLNLKPPSLENKVELFHLMSQYVDTRFLTWVPHDEIQITIELIKNLIESQIHGKGFHWCIYLENQIIGLVSLIDVRREIRTWTINRAELSYWIAKPFTGFGYATEASEAIIDFGLNKLLLHKIIIAHAKENIESEKICKKLNFIKYAHERDAFMKNQKWHDLVWYERLIR
jgi:ribosomal-protein-alanine N-acetyltransferase